MAQRDYTTLKNETTVKNQMRKDVMEVIVAALVAEFGEEYVKQVGNHKWAAAIGIANDSDGFPNNACVTIQPTVKDWEDVKRTKKDKVKYDIDEEAAAYLMSLDEKERKQKEKEEAKAKKIAADTATREKKKAEKEKENETNE